MKHTPHPEAVRGLVRWLVFLALFLIGVASASAHYDPRLGRWLSRDPLGEEGGVNLYAYCGNDPVNKIDPTGQSPLDVKAPSNEQIRNRMLDITAELGTLQEVALARNAVDCIGWRPPQFVNSGAAGVALRNEQQFLNSVLKVRGQIGSNGYGTWSTHSALSREFGWYGEDVRSFFVPQGGYAASTAIRKNLDYAQNATWWSLNLTSMAIPLPLPRALGVASAGSRTALLEGRLGPIIDMVPGPNGVLIPAFEARMLSLPARANVEGQIVLHQDQLIMNAYQRYYNRKWVDAVRLFNQGEITLAVGQNWKTVLGQEVDAGARAQLRKFLAREGIPEGPRTDVLVNRWLRDPSGSGAYRIPDLRLMRTRKILDGTIGDKTLSSPQSVDFFNFSGGFDILFVRPTVGPIP